MLLLTVIIINCLSFTLYAIRVSLKGPSECRCNPRLCYDLFIVMCTERTTCMGRLFLGKAVDLLLVHETFYFSCLDDVG